MKLLPIDCPHCGVSRRFHISHDERNLRQCPACNSWFIFSGNTEIEALAEPITCPVDGCGASPERDDLPVHIIDEHDGNLD